MIQDKIPAIPDCRHCGLPVPICSCSTPDFVYYEIEVVRPDIHCGRNRSPEEGLSDFEKSTMFVEAFWFGRDDNLVHSLRGQGRNCRIRY